MKTVGSDSVIEAQSGSYHKSSGYHIVNNLQSFLIENSFSENLLYYFMIN